MASKENVRPHLHVVPTLKNESLYVGMDIGKVTHVAGFLSPTLLTRHQRFESCPALSFDNSARGLPFVGRSHDFLCAPHSGVRRA